MEHRAVSRLVRAFSALGAVAAAFTLGACADAPAGPRAVEQAAFLPGPHRDLIGTVTQTVGVLRRVVPLGHDITVTTTVNPGGGNVVNIPEAGVQINFPAKFVSKPTTFTITARAGSAVAYDFYPSGTFTRGVTITQRLNNIDMSSVVPGQMLGAYLSDWAQLDPAGTTAQASETLPTTFDVTANAIKFDVFHFSGYMVSTGRY